DVSAEESFETEVTKEPSWLRRQLSFSTINWKRVGVLSLTGLSLLHAAAKINKFAQMDSERAAATQRLDPTAHQHSPWPKNTTVYASSTQEQKASSLHSYTQDIVGKLRTGHYGSFQEAHLAIENNGVQGFFHYFPQVP